MTRLRTFGRFNASAVDGATQIVRLGHGTVVARVTPDEDGEWAVAARSADGGVTSADVFDAENLTERQVVVRLQRMDFVARVTDGSLAQGGWLR